MSKWKELPCRIDRLPSSLLLLLLSVNVAQQRDASTHQ